MALVDKIVDRKKTRALAEAYLKFLYTPLAQEIEAKHYYRPRDARSRPSTSQFPEDPAGHGRWGFRRLEKAQATHFGDGGVFDQIYQPGK